VNLVLLAMISRKFATTIALSICFLIAGAQAQGISVQLDGRTLQFDQPPAMLGGRLLVPLRGIFEALKADVVYDGATRSIQATKGSRVVQLQLGSRTAIIDGKTLFLDVPADTIGGRTMVPLRFVSEALGADVKWDGPTKTVRLSSTGGDSTAPTPPPNNNNTNDSGQAAAPKISQVFHNATTALNPGQNIDVILYGDSGGVATFEILGATQNISLPEVSPGKYQTRWTIPNGLSVNEGVLLAHLTKNGMETATEAKRPITVTGSQAQPQPAAWQLTPTNGSVVNSVRPEVVLNFPQNVQANSVRFYVDGVDFSNQVQVQGRRMTWKPGYDLSATQHQAEVQALAANGQQLSQKWGFNINPNAGGGSFNVSQLRPADGATAGPRDQIGIIFNENVRSVSLTVDNVNVTNLAGIQNLANGITWNPNYNLNNGQHQARVQAVSQSGQVINRDWTWTVGASTITNFTVTPSQVTQGQQINVRLNGPTGATGTFTVGQNSNLNLRETSTGVYEGSYRATNQDRGTVTVQSFLRLNNGQTLSSGAQRVTFQAAQAPLSVTNLSNGMTIAPVFNVQGRGQPGFTVAVTVEYTPANVLGAIVGQMKTIRNQTVVSPNGVFDVPIDGSAIRQGQQFRLTVSDGQNPDVQMVLTRQ
jgi:copper amine oxidase-like protein